MKRCLSTLLLFLALGVLRGQEIGDVVSLSGDSLRLDRVVELTSDGVVQRDLYGDRIKAKSLFEEALALREDDVAANYQMSILLHGEDAQKALIFAKRAYDADTTNKWSQEQYAQTLLMLGRYDDAQALFRKMIAREDNNPDYYRVLALLYQYTQRPHTAISVLDSAELKVGKNPFLSRIKQGLLLLTHQEQRALDDALEMVANTPYDIQSRLSLADVYVAMGRDSLAEMEYNEALSIDSSSRSALVSACAFYEKRERVEEYFDTLKPLFNCDDYTLEESLATLGRLTRDKNFYRVNYIKITELIAVVALRYPKESSVVDLRANHLIAFGMLDEALELYKLTLTDSLPHLEHFQSVIEIEGYKKRVDSVDLYVKRAISHFPKSVDLYLTQANARGYSEDFEGAKSSYAEALKYSQSDTLSSTIWGYIGDVEYQISLKETKDSKVQKAMKRCYAAYEKALDVFANNVLVLNNYAYFLSEEEGSDLEYALSMSTIAISLQENNPTHLDTHAWILFKLGRLDEAAKFMRTAISLDTTKSPELPLHYGDILAAQGNNFMAEVYWKRAEAQGYSAEEIQKRIDSLKQGE